MQENSPYEFYNGQIGVRIGYIIQDGPDDRKPPVKVHENSLGLVSYWAYQKKCDRTPGFRLRQGKGQGNEALINWVVMPQDWREQCKKGLGDPEAAAQPTILEQYYKRDQNASDFYSTWRRPNDTTLDLPVIKEYTTNASVLNAIIVASSNRKAYRKALGKQGGSVWASIVSEVEIFRKVVGHTLKIPSLARTLSNYRKDGYKALISGKYGNQNKAKIKEGVQIAMLEELLKKHNNLDNEQICSLYNIAAEKIGWETISPSTVANYRKQLGLYIEAGRRGVSNFRNTRAMQVKRRAPAYPLYFWSLDGWDAELLYQRTFTDANSNTKTTYHNRLNAVVVLDPCCKYPVGYAIGLQENTALIKEALRNAVNHTKELFGQRYKPLQLQSDHYGIKAMTPLYEAMAEYYTPAKVKNAKSKPVEPYFKALNKKLQYLPNWSGFGVTADKDKQPNAEYLNKIRHSFPDEQGCRMQLIHMLEVWRAERKEKYLEQWAAIPTEDKKLLDDASYLNLFGETTGFTNRLQHYGLTVTIEGQEKTYDSFDLKFRELAHTDWCVKFDPDNLNQVLVVDAESRNGKLERIIGARQFMLTEKYVQPMALRERQDGDAAELAMINRFNAGLEKTIIERGGNNMDMIRELIDNTPALEGTLTKLLLVDSMGQHKDNKSNARLMEGARKLEARQERKAMREAEKELVKAQEQERSELEQYIDSSINMDDYIL